MTEEPLVSVIINCYNGEKYLKEAIDSILAQTYHNWEVIIWDNQSTDKTAEIVRQYNDDRIGYYYAQDHVMLGVARNQAMSKAKGEFITFLDYDDVWLPSFLDKIISTFGDNGEEYAFVYSNYFNWIESTELIVNNQDNHSAIKGFYDLLASYSIGMSAVVIKSSILKQMKVTFNSDYQLIEDYEFFLKLAYHQKAYYIADPLMKYRMHSGSLTVTMRKNWGAEFQQLYDDLTNQWLTEEEIKQCMPGLKWLKVRIARSEIEKNVREGHRIKSLLILLKNVRYSFKLWVMLLVIILPTSTYMKIMHKLRRRDYAC